jgi:hypothetical protein
MEPLGRAELRKAPIGQGIVAAHKAAITASFDRLRTILPAVTPVHPLARRQLELQIKRAVMGAARTLVPSIAKRTAPLRVTGINDLRHDLLRLGVANTVLDHPEAPARHGGAFTEAERRLQVLAAGRWRVAANRATQQVSRAAPDARPKELVDLAEAAVHQQSWRVERIARTEASRAYNQARSTGMAAINLQGLRQQWQERIVDGKPLDNRVAADSIAMHGQVKPVGVSFDDPTRGRKVAHPPNRPRDRSVVMPYLHGR